MNQPVHFAPASLSPASSRSWHGHLDLEFTHRFDRAETRLSHSHVQAPLKVQRPFYPEGAAVCHVVTLHTAGGVVGGDRLSQQIRLQPGSQALMTTAAAGKIYQSNGLEAQQSMQIQVAEGACLEWLPQETIVFDGAIYQQQMQVDLAEHATWLGWEITRLGRSARGEKLTSGVWRSTITVRQAGQLIWVDPQWVQGGGDMMNSPHGLAGHPVVGSFALIGRDISADVIEKARSLWSGEPEQIGVTRLMSGFLCRYRGPSTLDARRWLTQVWQVCRELELGRSACRPRVW